MGIRDREGRVGQVGEEYEYDMPDQQLYFTDESPKPHTHILYPGLTATYSCRHIVHHFHVGKITFVTHQHFAYS